MDFIKNNRNILIINLFIPIFIIVLLNFIGMELFNDEFKISFYKYTDISYNITGSCNNASLSQKVYGNYGKPYDFEKKNDKIYRIDKNIEESICRVTLKYKEKNFSVSNSIYSILIILFTVFTSTAFLKFGYKKSSIFYVFFLMIIFILIGFYLDIYSIHMF